MDPDELLAIALELVEQGGEMGVTLRILGHLAVREHTKKNRYLIDLIKRVPTHDIDFMGYSKDINQANRLFINTLGYKPDPSVAFSQEYGVKRLIYHHDNGVMAEIFLDELHMAHHLDFKDRLNLDYPTISLIDLLLSKLQIHQLTEKDTKDIIILLAEHDFGSQDRERIDIDYLLKLTREDWGLYYTARNNLLKANSFLGQLVEVNSSTKETVEKGIETIINRMDYEPKSFRWKARAKIGTRMKWYEDVDDVHR
jgi:hypothetical protein